MITIGWSRGEKEEIKTPNAHNIKIGDNNIGSDTSSSTDSNKVLTKEGKDEDNISYEKEEDGERTNISKENGNEA